MLPLSTKAPYFELLDTVSDKILSINRLQGDCGTVVLFICNHCPFVKHVNRELVKIAGDYMPSGISFVAISSNDVANYPEDAPHLMKLTALEQGYPFPYLYDETQEVARAYDAACTPDIYLFDKDLLLVYRGQLDDSRPGNGIPVNGKDLRDALDKLLSGKDISRDQKPSLGCNIKWK